MAAADLSDHTALDGTLDQFVKCRCGAPLCFGGLARQRQQFQSLRWADTPGTPWPRDLVQPLESLSS